MPGRGVSRRGLLGAGAAALAGAGLSGCAVVPSGRNAAAVKPNKPPAPGRPRTIEVYNNFGSTVGAGIVKCAQDFEAQQDEIGVRVTFAPATGSSGSTLQQKLFTAIAGGQAPDVAFCDASVAPQWTQLNMMTDLTDYFVRDGILLDDFFPVCARSMAYRDRIWAVQWDADANFPFYWNKNLFEESGLDPERPPTTLEEIEMMSAEINRIEGGRALKVGMIPWNQYGAGNSILTWGFSYGAKLWDPETLTVTPDEDLAIQALEWMTRSAQSIGGAAAVSIAPPSLSAHPFSTGNLGMACMVTPNLVEVKELAPDIEIGSTLLPFQPPGATDPGQGAWLGGWSSFIPRGAGDPDAAWEFVKWLGISDEGTSSQWENVGFPVGYAKAAINETIKNDETTGVYWETLANMKNTRPLVPVNNFYFTQLQEKVEMAVYGQIGAAEAMRQVRELTEREAERFSRVG